MGKPAALHKNQHFSLGFVARSVQRSLQLRMRTPAVEEIVVEQDIPVPYETMGNSGHLPFPEQKGCARASDLSDWYNNAC
jgi:hypothetical protein